ncbi:hypothetical protein, partial [Pasteurella multocida]|uniref:hypothetical protein n=1 Tax=Pasteurella multocida TaxID=747 RepID=UPI001B87B046
KEEGGWGKSGMGRKVELGIMSRGKWRWGKCVFMLKRYELKWKENDAGGKWDRKKKTRKCNRCCRR